MAAARLGVIFTILNDDLKLRNLKYIIEDADPSIIFASKKVFNQLESQYENLSFIDDYLYCNWGEDIDLINENVSISCNINKQDLACIIYTSGSSSRPKGVMITHNNITFSTKAIQKFLKIKREDTIGNFLPLSFDYGMYQTFLAFNSGATLFLGQKKDIGPLLLKKIEKWNITCLPLVPSIAEILIKLRRRASEFNNSLRIITNTGEKLSQELIKQLGQLFNDCDIFLMYGLTECKRVSILDSNYLELKKGSVGKPLDETKCYIVDHNDEILPHNSVGQLVVIGENVTSGYWKLPELTQHKFRSWKYYEKALYTGDLCSMDEEGFLYFHGRDDDVFKNKGFRVSSLEIEDTVEEIEGINKAIVSKPTEKSKRFILYVVSNLTQDIIWKRISSVLEDYKMPDEIVLLTHIPLNVNGKVDKQKIKSLRV